MVLTSYSKVVAKGQMEMAIQNWRSISGDLQVHTIQHQNLLVLHASQQVLHASQKLDFIFVSYGMVNLSLPTYLCCILSSLSSLSASKYTVKDLEACPQSLFILAF
ncbi:hypothetical protein Droror1_Dr00010200 [Drosera rotundifolia]